MTPKLATSIDPTDAPHRVNDDIKRVPDDAEVRRAIRSAAAELAADFDRSRPLVRTDLERHAGQILQRLELPTAFLGFTMVAVSNAYWLPIFESIPFSRRLFLLPHCLSNRNACTGTYDSIGLHCAGCGSCDIHTLKSKAEALGYSVIVAEGTSSVLFRVLEGEADAIFGVACLDSLEKSFQRIVELGIPHLAVPLLKDGCVDTEMETDQVRALLSVVATPSLTMPSMPLPRSYVGLLRETGRLFQTPALSELLSPYLESNDADLEANDAKLEANNATALATKTRLPNHAGSVEAIAVDWLREGGKRLRPFVTLAAYAVAKHSMAALDSGCDYVAMLPVSIRRIALAIEALHKASLVHDDIEDNDDFRYGQPTLHRVYGVAQTINIGDFLIGLGYRLIAGESGQLGAACTGDILTALSHAHLELCRGQGAELRFQQEPRPPYEAADVMKMAAQKTSPAFEVALYAGLHAAGASINADVLRRFATYLGEAFQIRNDLDDWQEDKLNKQKRGLDARAGRMTLLHAFAAETEYGPALAQLTESLRREPSDAPSSASSDALVEQVYALYHRSGAFAKVERLYQKLRDRALVVADEFSTPDLNELMRFLVRIILQEPAATKAP
jgi:geranylgeranyl pyrophosphate synthase